MLSLLAMVLFGQLHHFEFNAISSPQTAGSPFSITVQAYDSGNNPYNYNGYANIYSSWDIPANPQYCDELVQFSGGIWSGTVTVSLAADTLSLICDDRGGHLGTSNVIQVIPNVPALLLSVLPGQTYTPGLSPGRTGSPNTMTAGVAFNTDVYLTDNWFNTVDTVNHTIRYSSTDPFAVQSQMSLVNGAVTLSYAFRTASASQQISFSDITNPSINSDVSSAMVVTPGLYTDLLVILPGETPLPGDTTKTVVNTPGKSGIAEDQYEQENFDVIVYSTDSMWNQVVMSGNQIQLQSHFIFSNPAPQNLTNGQAQFIVNFSETGRVNLFANDNMSGYESDDSYLNILAIVDTSVTTDSFLVYPNPMGIESNTMVFAYYLEYAANITFEIYDPFGNLVVKRDWNAGTENAQAGMNRFLWNGRNDRNVRVASGIYYAIVKAWTHTATIFHKKMKVGVVW